MLLLLALVIVAVLIARKPKHKPLRPVAQINSADLYLFIRRSELQRQARETAL